MAEKSAAEAAEAARVASIIADRQAKINANTGSDPKPGAGAYSSGNVVSVDKTPAPIASPLSHTGSGSWLLSKLRLKYDLSLDNKHFRVL